MPKLIGRFSICLVFAIIAVVLLIQFSRPHQETQGVRPDDNVPALHVQWHAVPIHNPISHIIPLPDGNRSAIPQLQHTFSRDEHSIHRKIRLERLKAISDAFDHSWQGYKDHAWLHDEITPLTADWQDTYGGWAATLVDSLDTLWIMEKHDEFEAALKAVKKIDFSTCKLDTISVFETTIRYLGGFLGAYDISRHRYPELLTKANEVGEMLYKAFDTPNHMPVARWDWQEAASGEEQSPQFTSLLAEIGSLSLEFTRLSQLTKDPKYFDIIQRITDMLRRDQSRTLLPGLWPLNINTQTADATEDHTFSLGGMADSVYEYLPKQYLLLAGGRSEYRQMYKAAIKTTKKYLAFEPLIPPLPEGGPESLAISKFPGTAESELKGRNLQTPLILGNTMVQGPDAGSGRPRPENPLNPGFDPQGQHLTCFAGGMAALAARAFADFLSPHEAAEELNFATRLTEGCAWSYRNTASGIGPEVFYMHACRRGLDAVTGGIEPDWAQRRGNCTWDRDIWLEAVQKTTENKGEHRGVTDWEEHVRSKNLREGFTYISDARYILRPEAVESLFVLYRITGEEKYREAGWTMFESIDRRAKTPVSYAGVEDVMIDPPGDQNQGLIDSVESFWTAETLKYLYLLFSDDHVASLDEFVFNTEAHPFKWRTVERSSELILK